MIRLIFLAISAFTAGFGLGYVKFFLLTTVSQGYSLEAKDWIIQLIGALLTMGPFLIYIVAAAVASAYKKRYVMLFSGLSTAILLFIGKSYDWYGGIWLYLFVTGLLTGIFNPAKNAAVPLQALYAKTSTETVNGILNTTYILGLMGGIPFGTEFAEHTTLWGDYILYASFILSALFGYLWNYEGEDAHLRPFKEASRTLMVDTKFLLKKYKRFLTASPLLWGVGCTASLAVVAYAEIAKLGNSTECSLMAVYPVLGIISGNIAATKLVKFRTKIVPISCFTMTATIWGIPHIVEFSRPLFASQTIYWFVASMLILFGFLFGITTNLIEAEYFRRVYSDKREGSGAALLSAGTALIPALLGIIVAYALHSSLVSIEGQFTFLAIATLLASIVTMSIFYVEGDCWMARRLVSFGRFLLRSRYNIAFSGLSDLKEKVGTRGILLTPNHPAETDPIIMVAFFWRIAPIRPVIVERYYNLPFFNHILKLVRAIPLPDIEQNHGYYSRKRLDDALREISNALERGENVLFYPSGHIMRAGYERLKGNSGLQKILQNAPHAKVVLARTRGLRGSLFSAALTGITPPVFPAMRKAALTIIKNFIFFIPKRDITVHFEPAPTPLPINGSVQELNSFFEFWYNQEGEDKPVLVPYSHWGHDLPEIQVKQVAEKKLTNLPQALQDEVIALISPICDIPADRIKLTHHLGSDLGMDSLMTAQLLRQLEEKYNVTDVELIELQTVASVVTIAMQGNRAKQKEVELKPAAESWTDITNRPDPLLSSMESVQDAFIKTSRRMRGYAAMGDESSGVISWHKLEIAVHLLANEIKRLPNERIGIMLPSSCGASIVILAVLFAGKIPVMLNWTMGSQGLQHALNISKITHVLTAGVFLDKLDVDLSCLDQHFYLLESLKQKITLRSKLTAVVKSFLPAEFVTPKIKNSDETLTILFTSGSETVPKAVPLSHKNLLSNIAGVPQILKAKNSDVLLGFLPPFHSFGLMATVFFPLLTGLRIAYHANPNESRFLAKSCKKWSVTITAGTPTFLRGILDAGEPEDFTTLELIVAGAEKVPQSLVEAADKAHLRLIEGYGITECSPVVAANAIGEERIGVGRPFPGVEVLIVSPETLKPLSAGETGLILIRGDTVFNGYLDNSKDPFVTVNGKRWYNSGDLGCFNGASLVLAGRLKRFAKIGGEMVSLPAIESALAEAGLQRSESPLVVLAKEKSDGSRPDLILITTSPVTKDEANTVLRDAGFSNLVRIKEVRIIDEIPLLGTGKTDLRTLQQAI